MIRRFFRSSSSRLRTRLPVAVFFAFLGAAVVATVPDRPAAAQDQQSIRVRVGTSFSILLSSNPSTGYSWQLAAPLDPNILRLVSSEYVGGAPGGRPLVGASKTQDWVFQAVGKGTTTINLQYFRQWETDVTPIRTHRVLVEVY